MEAPRKAPKSSELERLDGPDFMARRSSGALGDAEPLIVKINLILAQKAPGRVIGPACLGPLALGSALGVKMAPSRWS